MKDCSRRGLLLSVMLLLLSVWYFAVVNAQCNTCSNSSNLACVSQTQFQVCDMNGFPTGSVYTCPTGYGCSTRTTTICLPNTGNVDLDCTECNICDLTNTFACTGLRTFALCLGSGTISSITGSCAPSLVCSIDYTYICGNATMGITATCPSVDDGTTTPTQSPSSTNPVTYCQTIQQRGRFPVGTDISSTCKQYILCFMNNNAWSGAIYNCPGSTYFNSSSQYCTPNVPSTCTGSVTNLMLRSNTAEGINFSLI